MLVYRAVRSNPPTEADFRSPAGAGRRIPSPELERTFRAVSTHLTPEGTAEANRQVGGRLGTYIAELDLPDTVERVQSGLHLDLYGTTPQQLLGYVRNVTPISEGTIEW